MFENLSFVPLSLTRIIPIISFKLSVLWLVSKGGNVEEDVIFWWLLSVESRLKFNLFQESSGSVNTFPTTLDS